MNLFVFEFHDVLVWYVQLPQLFDLLLLDSLQQSLLALEGLLQLLILDVADLLAFLLGLVLLHDLLLQLDGVLLEQLFSLVLESLFQLPHFLLLPDDSLELCLLGSGLLFQHALFLLLLLAPGILQLLAPLGSDFGFDFLLFSGSSLVGLGSSFGSQCIQFCLSV